MGIFKQLLGLIAIALLLLGLYVAWLWVSVVEEPVEFRSGDLILRGTLRSPRADGAAPGVVLVHGSGAATRKSMMVYAWLFAVKGYAALAYDKRGLGASDGGPDEWRRFRFEDLAADAAAGYEFLQSHDGIDANRVGYFGASQGAWVVSLSAHQAGSPAFLMMASASVSTVAEDRVFGRAAQVRNAGFDDVAIEESVALIEADHAVSRTGSGYETYIQRWNEYQTRPWFETVYGDQLPEPLNSSFRQWQRTILDFDPVPLLREFDAPALWLLGDPALDRFSPVALSVERLRQAKTSGACYRIIQIDGAGHTLEPGSDSGLVASLRMRIALVLDIYQWLDDIDTLERSCQGDS